LEGKYRPLGVSSLCLSGLGHRTAQLSPGQKPGFFFIPRLEMLSP
jgi:hypothetical protein